MELQNIKYLGKAKVEYKGIVLDIKLTRIDLANNAFCGIADFAGTAIELRNKATNDLSLDKLLDLDLTLIGK